MIDGVGLPPPSPLAPASAATASPLAGSFLNLLAGGFAFPAPVAELLEAPTDERASDPERLEADPTGFLSTWFGLTPLPPAANDAGFTDAPKGATALPITGALPGSSPAPLPGVPTPLGIVEPPPLAEGRVTDIPAFATALLPETVAPSASAVAPLLGVDAAVTDTALEGFGAPVQDPGASLGGRAVERLAPAAASVAQPLNVDADFEAAFDAQLRWQVETGLSEAVIDLNPAELGALTIRIQMHGDQTSLQIHAAEAATRQLLQQLLPQMGERLAQSGLFYSGGEVRDRMREEGEADTASGAASRTTTGRRTIRIHLVDAYA